MSVEYRWTNMKNRQDRAIALRRSAGFLALAGTLLLPLAGCMSSGASSLADGLVLEKPVAAAPAAQATAEPRPATSSSGPTARKEIYKDGKLVDTVNVPIGPTSMLTPQDDNLPDAGPDAGHNTETVTASVEKLQVENVSALVEEPPVRPVEVAHSAVIAPLAAESADEPVADTAEAQAEARIKPLFASIDHGQCKGGWGPKPQMINARRVTNGDPYYIEMRMRHTPPLPIGHVYVAYGRLGADGEPLDEHLIMLAPIGGYGSANPAKSTEISRMKPDMTDCSLRPVGAYRVSLNAQNYEKLLKRIAQAKREKPMYQVWSYNCNHFLSDIVAPVGILPPVNRQTASLQYFYEMMDRNEGRKVARGPASLKLASFN